MSNNILTGQPGLGSIEVKLGQRLAFSAQYRQLGSILVKQGQRLAFSAQYRQLLFQLGQSIPSFCILTGQGRHGSIGDVQQAPMPHLGGCASSQNLHQLSQLGGCHSACICRYND
jgi:hypothetical protein